MVAHNDSCGPNAETSNIEVFEAGETRIEFRNDVVSDRIRCDFPFVESGALLADTLIKRAEDLGRGKIISIVTEPLVEGLQRSGFRLAAHMPNTFGGKEDIFIVSYNVDAARLKLANPKEVSLVENILGKISAPADPSLEILGKLGHLKIVESVPETKGKDISTLISENFPNYPTPSYDPSYIENYIQDGNFFHGIRNADRQLVACASADLVMAARTAELTDCATRLEYRGRGYMRAILLSLMMRLRNQKRFPTAFTMARARIPGINIVFKQLGFKLCGQLSRSCHIGEGLEDMNIWARKLY